jgi:hypothetical protein
MERPSGGAVAPDPEGRGGQIYVVTTPSTDKEMTYPPATARNGRFPFGRLTLDDAG